mmetsp:Transcript_26172/g.65792  ORF Transcript_26172/g.65792 Transcript_26172/m.65792 type:complete len:205 (+) Transcript_26172:2367-2981(+)
MDRGSRGGRGCVSLRFVRNVKAYPPRNEDVLTDVGTARASRATVNSTNRTESAVMTNEQVGVVDPLQGIAEPTASRKDTNANKSGREGVTVMARAVLASTSRLQSRWGRLQIGAPDAAPNVMFPGIPSGCTQAKPILNSATKLTLTASMLVVMLQVRPAGHDPVPLVTNNPRTRYLDGCISMTVAVTAELTRSTTLHVLVLHNT